MSSLRERNDTLFLKVEKEAQNQNFPFFFPFKLRGILQRNFRDSSEHGIWISWSGTLPPCTARVLVRQQLSPLLTVQRSVCVCVWFGFMMVITLGLGQ